MAEYIDREIAKGSLRMNQHRFTCADEANGFGSVKWSEDVIYAEAAQKAIDTIPSADVAEVIKAKWIWFSSTYDRTPCEVRYRCSNCHYEVITHGKNPTENFCSNCGADMRGAE